MMLLLQVGMLLATYVNNYMIRLIINDKATGITVEAKTVSNQEHNESARISELLRSRFPAFSDTALRRCANTALLQLVLAER